MTGSKTATVEPQGEADQLRQLIREAHETIKDLRREVREARAIVEDFSSRSKVHVNEYLAHLGKHVNQLLDDSTVRVTERFPVCIVCPGCSELVAVLVDPAQEKCNCGNCGRNFLVRFRVQEDAESRHPPPASTAQPPRRRYRSYAWKDWPAVSDALQAVQDRTPDQRTLLDIAAATGVGQGRIASASLVLKHAPDLIPSITSDRSMSLFQAAEIARLRRDAPDLAAAAESLFGTDRSANARILKSAGDRARRAGLAWTGSNAPWQTRQNPRQQPVTPDFAKVGVQKWMPAHPLTCGYTHLGCGHACTGALQSPENQLLSHKERTVQAQQTGKTSDYEHRLLVEPRHTLVPAG